MHEALSMDDQERNRKTVFYFGRRRSYFRTIRGETRARSSRCLLLYVFRAFKSFMLSGESEHGNVGSIIATEKYSQPRGLG